MSDRGFGIIAPHPPIIVPGVGGKRAEVTHATLAALEHARVALEAFDPELLVLMSPHAPALADALTVDDAAEYEGDLAQFGDRDQYPRAGDVRFAEALIERLEELDVPVLARSQHAQLGSGELDHGAIVPLHFLDRDGRYPIVELSLSYLSYADHRRLGEAVADVAEQLGVRVAFIASGDLAHRLSPDAPAGYSPLARELDAAIVEHVRTGDFEGLMHLDPDVVEAGGECGLRSFIALGGFLGDGEQPTRVLSYEGPWGVGYLVALAGEDAVAAYDRTCATAEVGSKGGTAGADASEIVRLARRAIEAWVREGRVIDAAPLTGTEYPAQAGAFVSLHENGELRGCIGTIGPTSPTLAHEIVHNAIEAAAHDPRFEPVEPDELDSLDIKVDVLHAPEPATMNELDPKHYGVIVGCGIRRGLLLPDLEGIEDAETQVAIAARKGGIYPDDPVSLERFRVDRYT